MRTRSLHLLIWQALTAQFLLVASLTRPLCSARRRELWSSTSAWKAWQLEMQIWKEQNAEGSQRIRRSAPESLPTEMNECLRERRPRQSYAGIKIAKTGRPLCYLLVFFFFSRQTNMELFSGEDQEVCGRCSDRVGRDSRKASMNGGRGLSMAAARVAVGAPRAANTHSRSHTRGRQCRNQRTVCPPLTAASWLVISPSRASFGSKQDLNNLDGPKNQSKETKVLIKVLRAHFCGTNQREHKRQALFLHYWPHWQTYKSDRFLDWILSLVKVIGWHYCRRHGG